MVDYMLTCIYIILFIGTCLDLFWLIPELQEQVELEIMTVGKAVIVFIFFPLIWLPTVGTFIFIKTLKGIGVL